MVYCILPGMVEIFDLKSIFMATFQDYFCHHENRFYVKNNAQGPFTRYHCLMQLFVLMYEFN